MSTSKTLSYILHELIALKIPIRRWGTVAKHFIVHLPETGHIFDSITTSVDFLSWIVLFITFYTSDTAEDVTKHFGKV